ncbi:hypothetical protein MPL1032_80199 [Mesorhizobium plurifarium]|nr:hypothetical protein MPL1032_80199 [Mesorhizobium plurifarium]
MDTRVKPEYDDIT